MTREEHLKFCQICKNQKFNMNMGIICRLTDQIAEFEESCESFDENAALKQEFESLEIHKQVLRKTVSLEKRLVNYLIDLVCVYLFSFIFGVMLGFILVILAPSTLSFFEEDHKMVNYAFAFVVSMMYYTFLEFTTGRTIGKFITKTKVVKENGDIPGFGTLLLRSLCRLIPFEAFSFLGTDHSGWHDKLSKTKVISV